MTETFLVGGVRALCAGIDAGTIVPTEDEMAAWARLVAESDTPPLVALHLLVQLALRCDLGRAAVLELAA